MSNINIKRAVEAIRANTTVYTPIVEVIVNAIQAIESGDSHQGKVSIRVHRDQQQEMLESLPPVNGVEIEDNGIGFTEENREAFDTLYTDLKIKEGGKGFGRFTCLKYFESMDVDSVYKDVEAYRRRRFSMGKEKDIIVNETVEETEESSTGSLIHLRQLKAGSLDKKLDTVGRHLVEKLLPYFIAEGYACPEIELSESDSSDTIRLNDYFSNELADVIREIPLEGRDFSLKGTGGQSRFTVRVFKLYYPNNQKSKISLVAHKREVSGSFLHKYVPEFIDEFYDPAGSEKGEATERGRNFIVKAYVFGKYLDENVSIERGGFEFQAENDLVFGISQADIETRVAAIAKSAVGEDVSIRQQKKKEAVQKYVDQEAPWHKSLLSHVDLSGFPYNPTSEEIESRLQRAKFSLEMGIKRDVRKLLEEGDLESMQGDVHEIVDRISENSKNDLVHYIALRKSILELFGKSLELDEKGKYESEGIVHDIIFPRKGDTDVTTFEDHNLWMIDERLNFTNYVSSDKPLNGGRSGRPDLLVYDNRLVFRGDNEASNPVTVFEFKKPQRDDFVNPSSDEDPIQQVVRYVNNIRAGKYRTPKGRKILIADNTPFYGYVVCDLTPKIEDWLELEKNFKPMPDRLGWFSWLENINLYVEVVSWDKIVKDAQMRNDIFFQTLGI